MFPVRDDNPQLSIPWVTYGIAAANTVVWILLQGMGSEPTLSASICRLGLIPAELAGTLPAGTRIDLGPQFFCELGGTGSWYTVISSMFMHGGWMHIIGNMWFLLIFGDNVEDAMGSFRFAVFYLLCGIGAAGLQVATNPGSAIPMVGASGAIGGLLGAYVLLYPRVRVHLLIFLGFYVTTVAVPAVFMLGYWFVVQLLSGVASHGTSGGGVAFWAHVGGFASGAVLIMLFRKPELLRRHPYYGWRRGSPNRNWRRIDRR
jgi:membrane associated rhomboid family serine protease